MKINSVKRFILQDFPSDVQKWLEKLLQPLNSMTEQVISALQNNLTLKDNLKSKTYELTIQADQSYPITLAYPLSERPTDVRVSYCMEDSGSPSVPSSAYCVWWIYDSSSGLKVTMVGLDSSKRYKVNITAQV
jgi:hypothetical protein